MSNGASIGSSDWGWGGIRGVTSHARRGRWLELRLADGRGVAFDPIDVTGCTITSDDARETAITVYLRGRVPVHIVGVDGWALWELIAGGDR